MILRCPSQSWAQKAGHEIFFGVRDPKSDKVRTLLRTLAGKAQAGTPAEAATFADMIVLATPWNGAEAAIRSMGSLSGKIILDATRGAAVFKTLNTTGYGNMADPVFRGVRSVMFVAGDDAGAKPKVIALLTALGFEVIDAGPLRNARLLEAHAMLWIELALNRGLGRDFAFTIARR